MSTLLWIAPLLVMSSIAHADFSVTPPKGWKAGSADEAKAIADDEMRAFPGVQSQAKIWTTAEGRLEVTHRTFPPFDQEMTTAQFVDALADGLTRTFVGGGAKLTSKVKARTVNGQIVAERKLRGKRTQIIIVERALKAATGELQLMTVVCYDTAETACKKVAASAVLTPATATSR
jgi:hypothetical protein